MRKNASAHHFSRHLAMSGKRLIAMALAILLAGSSLPSDVSAESTKVLSLTIGRTVITSENAGNYGFSMETTEDGIVLQVDRQIGKMEPIRADGHLEIQGNGNFSTTVNVDGGDNYAIFATDGITISEAHVTASSGKRAAIYSPRYIEVNNSIVKAAGPERSKGILSGEAVGAFDSWLESTGYNLELLSAENSVVFQEEDGSMKGSFTGSDEESEGFILPYDVILPGDLEIPADSSLVIPSGVTLTIPEGFGLTVEGTVENYGTIDVKGVLEDPNEQIKCLEGGRVIGVDVQDVWLEIDEETLNVGESAVCSAQVVPCYAQNPQIAWTSSDSSIVSVKADGEHAELKALRPGTAVITASAGGKTAECEITVIETAVTGVSLNQTSEVMHVKDTLQLTAAVTPETAANKAVTWSSENPDIADVDADGLVTARGVGTTIITVTTKDGQKQAQCSITVEMIPIQSITLDRTEESLPVGSSLQLQAAIAPENADEPMIWSSSDEQIASVDQSGKVEAKAEGTVRITASSQDGRVAAGCEITVYVVPVEEITLTPASAALPIGKTLTLIPKVSPANATNPKVTWTTSDPEIAAVDDKGMVKAFQTGTITITAAAADGSGIMATSEITVVVIPVTGVKLNRTSASIPDDGSISLKAAILPNDATDQKVTWKSSNPQAAVVDAGGKVTAVKAGTTQITVTTADGGKEAVCTITVTAPDKLANTAALNKKIKLAWNAKKKGLILNWGKAPNADGYEIYAAKCGSSMKLVKTIQSAKTNSLTLKKINGKKLKNQSSYKAYVRAYRVFHGKKEYVGKSCSVHTAMSGNKKLTNVRKLTVTDKKVTLKPGTFKKLSVKTISQDNAKKTLGHTEKLRYFSSDGKVAVVTNYGTVRAVGKGKCTIYVLAVNGVKTTVQVTVK